MKEYKVTVVKGIVGDMAAEWMTEKDWENHRKHVEELKRTGEFGKTEEVSLTLMENPIFDTPKTPSESYSMVILNLK